MILAIDTSTRMVGLALYDGTYVLYESIWASQDFHTVELAPAIDEAMKRSGVEMADLQALAVAIGPGSFTGLRIGLAMAKGISLACHLSLLGIPTLDILAYAQPVRELPLVVALHAGRGRLAAGWYQSKSGAWRSNGTLEMLDAQALVQQIQNPTLVCGELSAEERRILGRKHRNVILAPPAQSLRRPSFLAEIAWRRWLEGKVDDRLRWHRLFAPG
jgi:tRNA threonylcarbamoyladenosine biosynthesis protein TsaB